ncbi:MAG: SurA N-terminal domain-containing protein [Thermodesulfobacteriaceae bacterium]|nr:SurA N-terminal domain-containing protein [Thermodesulfobacteriaceae bacterium]
MKGFIFLVFCLIFLYGTALGNATTISNATTINKIVAIVGDEVLTLYELNQLVDSFSKEILKNPLSPKEEEKVKESLRKEVLEQWIEDTVIGLEAKKAGIKVSDEEVEDFFKEELHKDPKELTYEEREKLKDRLRKIKFIQLLLRDKIVIPEDEVKKAYEAYVMNYDPSPKYKLEILIIKEEILVKDLYEEALKGKSLREIWQKNSEFTQYINETFKEDELDKKLREQLNLLIELQLLPPIKK